MNVLIVDDDQLCHEIVRTILCAQDISSHSCYNVDDALETLSKNSFDLIITDVIMPGQHGTDLIQHLRENGDQTPIIAITAGHENAVDDYVFHASMFADAAVPKPLHRKEFLDLIGSLVPAA